MDAGKSMCLLRPPPRSPSPPAFLPRARRAVPLEGTRECNLITLLPPPSSQNKSGGGAERKQLWRPEKLTVVTKVTVSCVGPTLVPLNLTWRE